MVRDEAEPRLLLSALRATLAHRKPFIILNVAEVAIVDSLWLGALLQGYTGAVRAGGSIKLLRASKRFHELKLDRVLEAFESEEEALGRFDGLQ